MPEATIADVMRAYATDAVAFARRHYDVSLDYSEASLTDVDRIVADYTKADWVAAGKLTSEKEEELWAFCKLLGGYVGEVIIRNIGGTWQMTGMNEESSSVSLLAAGRTRCSPPEYVWRSLTEPYKPVVSYYRALKVILGRDESAFENGIDTIHVPPLSDSPPASIHGKKRRWWQFW